MFSKPPILQEVEKVVTMQKTGANFKGLCPFHREDTPSFFVYKERFNCFGCGVGGDVIDFVKKYYNLDFLQAIKHLQIETGHVDMPKIKKKQELKNKFREWESGYFQELCMIIRVCKKILLNKLSWNQREIIYKTLPIAEYHADIIQHGSDRDKYELYIGTGKHFDYKLEW
jgi:hypothetical protein